MTALKTAENIVAQVIHTSELAGDALGPAQPVLVGIGYSFQETGRLPVQDWDIQMDFVATERELIECTSR